MKTSVKVPASNFQQLTIAVTDGGEYEISGLDGNGVAFQQTLAVPNHSAIFFDTSNRNFIAIPLQQEIASTMQLVDQIVREIV